MVEVLVGIVAGGLAGALVGALFCRLYDRTDLPLSARDMERRVIALLNRACDESRT